MGSKEVRWSGVPTSPVALDAHASRHENGGADEIDLTGLEGSEIRLTPKASSSGAEGTIFYDSDDNHVYVATE